MFLKGSSDSLCTYRFFCMPCCLSLQVQSKASAPQTPQASPAPPAPSTPPSSSIPPAPPAPPPRRRTPATKFLGFVPRFWIAKRCSANTPELMCRFSKSLPKFHYKRGIFTAACIDVALMSPIWFQSFQEGRRTTSGRELWSIAGRRKIQICGAPWDEGRPGAWSHEDPIWVHIFSSKNLLSWRL